MEITTTRFGTLEIDRSDRLCFPGGFPGFEDCRDWVLLAAKSGSEVAWLQSTVWPDLALAVVDPRIFVPDFEVRVDSAELTPLGLDNVADAQILVIVSQRDGQLTLNLRAPLTVNVRRRLGRQVLNSGSWSVQHFITRQPHTLRKSA